MTNPAPMGAVTDEPTGEKILHIFSHMGPRTKDGHFRKITDQRAIDFARAVIAALPSAPAPLQVAAEPVAWMSYDRLKCIPADEKDAYLLNNSPKGMAQYINEKYTIPLYAAALQVAQPAARIPDDAITVNLVRLAGLDKHKARECEAIVRQVLASLTNEQEGKSHGN